MRRHSRGMLGLTTLVLAALVVGAGPDPALDRALEGITPEQILAHIKVLASDEFEGRGPGTAGEEKTVAYLTGQFREMGLKPGNPDGTYVQDVPLVGFRATRVNGAVSDSAADRSACRSPTISWPSRDGWRRRSRSTSRTSSSSATAWSPRSTAGTTTRGSTCAARRWSCWSTTRRSPTRTTRRSSTRRCSRAGR